MTVFVVTKDHKLYIDRMTSRGNVPVRDSNKYTITDNFIYWGTGVRQGIINIIQRCIESPSGWCNTVIKGSTVYGYERSTGKIHTTDRLIKTVSALPIYGGVGETVLMFMEHVLGDTEQAFIETCRKKAACGNGYNIVDLCTGEVVLCTM